MVRRKVCEYIMKISQSFIAVLCFALVDPDIFTNLRQNPVSIKRCRFICVRIFLTETAPIQVRQQLRIEKTPGPRLNIKTVFPMYWDSNVKDKTVARPSYL